MTESTTKDLMVYDPSDGEIQEKFLTLSDAPNRFLTIDYNQGTDLNDDAVRALAVFALRYDLDPLANEVMIAWGKPYVTTDGLLRKARESGMLDFIASATVSAEDAQRIQAQIPPLSDKVCARCEGKGATAAGLPCSPCNATGNDVDRAYIAAAKVKLRGSNEAPVYHSYVLESERVKANAQTGKGKETRQPVVTHTEKQALNRAIRKALRYSGLGMAHFIARLDEMAAVEEGRFFGVATQEEAQTLAATVEDRGGFIEATAASVEHDPEPPEDATRTEPHDMSHDERSEPIGEAGPEEPTDLPPLPGEVSAPDPPAEPAAPEAPAWEPFPGFELPEGDNNTEIIGAAAASYGYTDGWRGIWAALLDPRPMSRAHLDEWIEKWSLRAVARLLYDVSALAKAREVGLDSSTEPLRALALEMQAHNFTTGEGIYNALDPETEQTVLRAAADAT